MRRCLLVVLAAVLLLGGCTRSGQTPETEADIVRAIKEGALGRDLAEKAAKTGELWLSEQKNTGLPYRTFCYYDYQAGHTVMLEGERLVLLCTGWGGGCASEYRLLPMGRFSLLSYEFQVGSGIARTIQGRYVLGTGAASWDLWP